MNWLVLALGSLTIASWLSTLLLVDAARHRPRIGVLTERAVLAVILSTFGTVCVVLVLNQDTGGSLVALETARFIFRVCLVGFLLIPVWWLWLYFRQALGER